MERCGFSRTFQNGSYPWKNTPLALTQGHDLHQCKSRSCPAVHLHDWLLTPRAYTSPPTSSPRTSETLITLRADEI